MKLAILFVVTALTILPTITVVENLSAATVKDVSKEAAAGTLGGFLGGRAGSLTTFCMLHIGCAILLKSVPRGEILDHSAAIGIHAGIPVGSAIGVYIASDGKGSLLWTTVGSYIPTLMSMIYAGIRGENVFSLIHVPPLTSTYEATGKTSIFGFRSAFYRGCLGVFFSPIAAVIAYELSRPKSSQQESEQPPQRAAPVLHIPLLGGRF